MTQAIQDTGNYVAQTYGRPPFVITHADGMRVWDSEGREYLDMVSGIAVMSLGHNDPQITQIIREQAEKLVHVSNLYFTEPQANLARALCENSFADRVFFCNSGTEANEACIKFARKVAYQNEDTERQEVIAFTHAFHGRTMGSLAVTPNEKYQKPFQPLMGGAKILPVNDISAAEKGITEKTCAVIIEPVQGEGGIRPVDGAFLKRLRELCDERGALLIFDEIQCGMGRTGTLWAHTRDDVTPDLMSLAKPLASGLPIGAALMTEKVHAAIERGDHGSTFAAGPLVCAVAHHVLERIADPAFLTHVNEVGEYLKNRLSEINAPQIKEIRGRGLMLGIELETPALDLMQNGYDHGLLTVIAGPETLRLVPPLIIQKSDVDVFIERFTKMLLQQS